MEALRRIKKVINWLIFKEIASNERELAEVMGYTKSSFSQIVTGQGDFYETRTGAKP
jgi:plasmid maintenance system antidote protein VapI